MKWIACFAVITVACGVGAACDSGGAGAPAATQTPSPPASLLADDSLIARLDPSDIAALRANRVPLCAITDSDPCPSATPPVTIGWPMLGAPNNASRPRTYYLQDSSPGGVAVYSAYADPDLVLVQQPASLSVPPFMSEEPDKVREAGHVSVSVWKRGDQIWARFETGATSGDGPIIGLVAADASKVSEDRVLSFIASLAAAQ